MKLLQSDNKRHLHKGQRAGKSYFSMRQRHNRSRQHEKGLTMKTSRIAKTALCLAAAAVLSACAGKSHVKADGTTDNPVFLKLLELNQVHLLYFQEKNLVNIIFKV